jgi:hypothetical protein
MTISPFLIKYVKHFSYDTHNECLPQYSPTAVHCAVTSRRHNDQTVESDIWPLCALRVNEVTSSSVHERATVCELTSRDKLAISTFSWRIVYRHFPLVAPSPFQTASQDTQRKRGFPGERGTSSPTKGTSSAHKGPSYLSSGTPSKTTKLVTSVTIVNDTQRVKELLVGRRNNFGGEARQRWGATAVGLVSAWGAVAMEAVGCCAGGGAIGVVP